MTDYTVEPCQQEDDQRSYEKLRAVREATPGLPCEKCEGRVACGISGHKCDSFKTWARTGSTTGETK